MVLCHELTNIRGGAGNRVEELVRALKTKDRAADIRKRLQLTLAHDAYINRMIPDQVSASSKK